MAAGDKITGDYQVEIRDTLFGDGETSWVSGPIGGLLVPSVRPQDTALAHDDGSVGGLDTLGTRIVTIPLTLDGSILLDAVQAWLPSRRTDIPLHLRLPIFGHIWFLGRPRGLTESLMSLEGSGTIAVLARFDALDPTIHTVGSQ